MDEHVAIVPETACSGLEQIVAKRKSEMEALKDEVRALEVEVDGPPSAKSS